MLGIALQQALPFKIAANALCDALRQFGEFGARGCGYPAKTNCAGGVLDVHPIEAFQARPIRVRSTPKPADSP